MNEYKFNGKGNVYSKARPSYPISLFDYLQEKKIFMPDSVVADIGAGTGIFTSQIACYAEKVYAVEPNDDMRVAAENLLKEHSNVTLVKASAENTSLTDSSVDVITVAQAFHWFDKEAFKTECRRILKPHGTVVLVWNDRDICSEIIADNFAVNKKYCPNFNGSSNGFDFGGSEFDSFFEGKYEVIKLDNSMVYDLDIFVSRNLSSSYALTPDDNHYLNYVDEIKGIFKKHSVEGKVAYPYVTRCFIGKV